MKLINIIKGYDIVSRDESLQKGNPYLSVYTIFAQNKVDDDVLKEKAAKVEGDALLRITLQTNLTADIRERLMEEIKRSGTSFSGTGNAEEQRFEEWHTVGEHDWIIKVPARNLFGLYKNNNILDKGNETVYARYFLQTNTKLCDVLDKPVSTEDDSVLKDTGEKKKLSPEMPWKKQIEDNYIEVRKGLFKIFPKTAGMVDSLDLLYGVFLSKSGTVSNKMWIGDFAYQFQAILDLFKSNLDEIDKKKIGYNNTSQILAEFRDILNSFEYQIIHIAESNNLFIETPKCHLRYTGQNNLAMYAYFGIVKEILLILYQKQELCRQSEIVPLILADSVPIIESRIYMDNDKPFEQKLLKLNLSMMALYNIPLYAPYLFHEIFHYAVPHDRFSRNWLRGNLLTILAIRNLLVNLIYYDRENEIHDKQIITAVVNQVFLPDIYSVVMERRAEIPAVFRDQVQVFLRNQDVNGNNGTGNELYDQIIEETCCIRKIYEKRLIWKLCMQLTKKDSIMLSVNIFYHVLSRIYEKRESYNSDIENWTEMIIPDPSEADIIVRSMRRYLDTLEGLSVSENPNENNRADSLLEKIESAKLKPPKLIEDTELFAISGALTEAVCDLAMVRMADIEAVHYLLSYVKIHNDLLMKANHIQNQDVIRIGIVLDMLYGFDKSDNANKKQLEKLSEEFIDLYTGLYFSIKECIASGEGLETDQEKEKEKKLKVYCSKLATDAAARFAEIKKCYDIYSVNYRMFSNLFSMIMDQYYVDDKLLHADGKEKLFSALNCKEYYQHMRDYGKAIRNANDGIDIRTFSDRLSVIEEARMDFREEAFRINVDIIQHYQKQEDFYYMQEQYTKQFQDKKPYRINLDLIQNCGILNSRISGKVKKDTFVGNDARKTTYSVRGVEDLLSAIQKISKHFKSYNQKIYADKEHSLWYRGMPSAEFMLLPSVMWQLAGKARDASYLCDFQRMKYEEFKFRQDDSSEAIDTSKYTACDYLALMQHYGLPTTYLDWSENAITSLYFALEAYIDPKKSEYQNDENAVLYVLNPNLYNKSRNELMKTYNKNSGRNINKALEKTLLKSTANLPNLSVDYNEDIFFMFLLGDGKGEYKDLDIPDNFVGNFLAKGSEELLYLPLAVYSSRANMRIRKQYGMFLAFNIFTPPNAMQSYDYMALQEIQNAYLNIFADKEPFLYKIEIASDEKKDIAEWLKAIGISKDMIYPELTNITERI